MRQRKEIISGTLSGGFTLGSREDLFMERHWDGLPRAAVESPSLEQSNRYVDVALRDVVC